MKKNFSYNVFGNETADTLVTTFNSLVEKSIEGKNGTPEYVEANQNFNTEFMKYCVETIPNMVFSDVKMLSNPMIHANEFFKSSFNTILAQSITPAVPVVVSNEYNTLYDVTQVGFGVTTVSSAH